MTTIHYPPSKETVKEMWQLLNLVEMYLSPEVLRLEADAIEESVLSDADGDIEFDEAYTEAGYWLDLLRDRVLGNVTAVRHLIETGRSSPEDPDDDGAGGS